MNKALRAVMVIMIMLAMITGCSVWENELGQDILPPTDRVLLYHDTIFDIHAYTASGFPSRTSDMSIYENIELTYLLGELSDTMTGVSTASFFTQYNLSSSFKAAPNTEIDSMVLHLLMPAFYGDFEEEFTISVYEAKDLRLYMDSLYYSDLDPEGKYEEEPLAEYTFSPTGEIDTVQIMLMEGPGSGAFLQKFESAASDTSIFVTDSAFRDHFNGLYLTATSASGEGSLARVALNDLYSAVTLRYANDSTEDESTVGRDFTWATFSINEYYSQKVNLFQHDYTGTYLSGIIDKDSMELPYLYVEGLDGASVRFSFNGLEEWLEGEKVSVTSAKLIFEVLPEELSGISIEEQPDRLMLYTENEGETTQIPVYDYIALSNAGDDTPFGGYFEKEAGSMFSDTTYRYVFNMNLHFQSMVDGTALVNDFRLQVNNNKVNPEITKLWSNLSTNPRRIRLEVVYLKL